MSNHAIIKKHTDTYQDHYYAGYYIGKRTAIKQIVMRILQIEFSDVCIPAQMYKDIDRATYSQLYLVFSMSIKKTKVGQLCIEDIYEYI